MRLPPCFPDLRVSFQGDVPQVGLLEAFAGHHPQSGCFNGLNILTWTPKPEPMLMRASPPARLGKEKPHESQTPQPRADHPQVAHR